MATLLAWTALEYPKKDRRKDWFWAVGIIAISGAVSAILSHNTLFAILILIAIATLLFYSKREPREIQCKITDSSIVVGTTAYPFERVTNFWIEEEKEILLIHADKLMFSTIAIAIDIVGVDAVRETLAPHLPESPLHRSPFETLFEYLGF